MSNVNPPRARKAQREAAQQFIDTLQGMAFPNSRRIYLRGSRSDIQCRCAKFSSARPCSAAAKTTHSMNPTRRSRCMTPPAPTAIRRPSSTCTPARQAARRLDRRARRYRHPKRRQFRLYPTAAGGRRAGSPALRTSAAAAQGAAGQVRDPAALCPRRYRHPRDGVHRHP